MKKLFLLLLLSTNISYALEWECSKNVSVTLKDSSEQLNICRTKLKNGWLVYPLSGSARTLTFISDKNHEWRI